jgi:hypothetical protein
MEQEKKEGGRAFKEAGGCVIEGIQEICRQERRKVLSRCDNHNSWGGEEADEVHTDTNVNNSTEMPTVISASDYCVCRSLPNRCESLLSTLQCLWRCYR